MLRPALRNLSINFVNFNLARSISSTSVRKMPFAKHEVVPDVIPVAPKNILKVDYISGGKLDKI